MREKKPLGIYVHIPFCVRKCNYCDFLSFEVGTMQDNNLVAGSNCGRKDCIDSEQIKLYIDAIKRELLSYKKLSHHFWVETIYFGGGTPSLIEAKYIADILDCIREIFVVAEDAEITLECNPGTTNLDKFFVYEEAGVNRLSIGLQTANPDLLKILGRVHTFGDFRIQYENARLVHFDNISLDLMSALPGQTLEEYKKDVETVIGLNPQHISSYGLILEEGTPFYEDAELQKILPDEDTAIAMYEETKRMLAEAGYQRYEISNYAKPGYESRHNSSYWTGVSYIGIGLGASSYLNFDSEYKWDNEPNMDLETEQKTNPEIEFKLDLFSDIAGVRYQNMTDLNRYIEEPFQYQMPGYRITIPPIPNEDKKDGEGCAAKQVSAKGDFCNFEKIPKIKQAEPIDLKQVWRKCLTQCKKEEITVLSKKDAMEEFMFLGLRMTKGVSELEFQDRFGVSLKEVYGDVLKKHIENKNMKCFIQDGMKRYALTDQGVLISNPVLADFLLE